MEGGEIFEESRVCRVVEIADIPLGIPVIVDTEIGEPSKVRMPHRYTYIAVRADILPGVTIICEPVVIDRMDTEPEGFQIE